MDVDNPRGTFGSVLHALTFGIFGEQKDRTQKYVEGNYKIQERKDDSGDTPQQLEEVHEEHEIS